MKSYIITCTHWDLLPTYKSMEVEEPISVGSTYEDGIVVAVLQTNGDAAVDLQPLLDLVEEYDPINTEFFKPYKEAAAYGRD